jgi:pimeloyl-ACP methyl ester carboxylesterase
LKRIALAAALAALTVAAPAGASTKSDVTVKSKDGTNIVISVYKPDGASAENPAPVILHSHGWGGSRTSSDGAFKTETDNGFGVVSIDQRGHGQSGGEANVEDPEFEGQDMIKVIDYVAGLDWVAKDKGSDHPNDPTLFAMGGSYGGGYQFVAAFTELRDLGYTRLNALAPEITWFNLSESLAPSKVVRTAWVAALFAAGADKVPNYIRQAFVYGAATGQWPDGSIPVPDAVVPNMDAEFFEHGPSGHVAKGRTLDIPVLIGQGLTDNLFNLNQGWKNFERALSDKAKKKSLFVGYNGGHALPNVAPLGTMGGGDSCSGPGGFPALRNRFFATVLAGENPSKLLPARYNLSTQDGKCLRTESLDDRKAFKTGFDAQLTTGTVTTTGAGAPQNHLVAQGPIKISGVPTVKADVTTAGIDQRVFFGIAVGASEATATVVQNNVMPLREFTPVVQQGRTIELPGIAVDVPAGQNVYLTISPVSDMFAGHGSLRTPGLVGLEDITVNLPVVGSATDKGKAARLAKAKRRAAARRAAALRAAARR